MRRRINLDHDVGVAVGACLAPRASRQGGLRQPSGLQLRLVLEGGNDVLAIYGRLYHNECEPQPAAGLCF